MVDADALDARVTEPELTKVWRLTDVDVDVATVCPHILPRSPMVELFACILISYSAIAVVPSHILTAGTVLLPEDIPKLAHTSIFSPE